MIYNKRIRKLIIIENEKWFRAENNNCYRETKSKLENDSGGNYIACIESSKSELDVVYNCVFPHFVLEHKYLSW